LLPKKAHFDPNLMSFSANRTESADWRVCDLKPRAKLVALLFVGLAMLFIALPLPPEVMQWQCRF